ncbi:alanine--tRNA ligase [Candidatus Saccharibacteria bacterium RIFCSPHIGHO2_01_FULL_49_21]|nr:MAG: alanine--tRNA ligase [Candidatus Saccharibacteria bacterium RIFCSPHIGHO2_01_FULL_49_21]
MTAQEIRKKYLEFFASRGHTVVPRASLIPQDDPTTLFTGSGMQPLIPYLLGQPYPAGKRVVDSQTCFRAEDMDEVGDNRHTTFFEMLGNWSLGDYYKKEQLPWAWEFLTKVVELDPKKIYVTCFLGDEITGVPKDIESAEIWKKLFADAGIEAKEVGLGSMEQASKKGMADGRIFYYDASKNWWSREGEPANMQEGEPGGPDSEMFYDFGTPHDEKFGKYCHPNCDCGRFGEVGNSVFMAYKKTATGFEKLSAPNVDFGGGLERIAAAANNDPDMFQISVLKPIIDGLEVLSKKDYQQSSTSMRVIADHLRAATFLAVDGVVPSNKEQGYVLRRLIRRAVRFAFDLGIEQDLCKQVVPVVADLYHDDFPEVAKNRDKVAETLDKEEKIFRQTLRKGLNELTSIFNRNNGRFNGSDIFKLYDTYGFPPELSIETINTLHRTAKLDQNWSGNFDELMAEQRKRSQTAAQGAFRGGLADASEEVVKLHTATHLMYRALKNTLGDHVVQRGSNITAERTRFDFSHPEKMTPEQIKKVEDVVNQKISEDLPVTWKEEKAEEALKTASGAFGDKYGDMVKVYTIGDPANPFSREVCGGPHVEHTGQIGLPAGTSSGGLAGKSGNGSTGSPLRKFKIVKEESSSAGVRRVKAVLQ